MPEKMNQSPAEMLNQNAAVAQNAEVPAPAAPVTPARQSYAEKVQGLTIDERNWMLAKSKAAAMAQLPEGFLPQTYTGNPGACAIACEMALRMGVSHLFVMQNLYVVHGMPTWSGKSCKALIDNCGQFAGRTRYRMEGEEGTETWGCRLIGVDKLTGEKVEGPKVTVKMAKDAGWWNKNGSYWPKMTEMMLKYRAAAYFARAECPEVLMGANIDYAIVISSWYNELKGNMSRREAIIQALDLSFPTVLTSGSILSAAGFLIGRITTEPAIVGIGVCLCRGTLISMFLVMFILPQILFLGDQVVERTRFNLKVPEVGRTVHGTVYVNGRVRGRISGVVDAHIQGVIYGDVSGMLETGNYQNKEASNDNETEHQ